MTTRGRTGLLHHALALRARAAAAAVTGSVLVAMAGGCTESRDGGADPAVPGSGGEVAGTSVEDVPAAVRGPALPGTDLFLDPDSPAAEEVTELTAAGRPDDAREVGKIAARPVAHWLTDPDPGRIRAEAADLVVQAERRKQMPVLVIYYIPKRDCGSYSAGGAPDGAAYRRWVHAVAAGISGHPATVVVEPDAVAQTLDACRAVRDERLRLLGEAISVLRRAGARIYLDAGNPDWIKDIGALAGALRAAGIEQADGFALNVSNFVSTEANVGYGNRLSDALGGAHFVVDTSRNGNGPWSGAGGTGTAPNWCNPPGRALGTAPTTRTGLPRVDALLWVKRPGESDGACRPGEPPAGQWWAEYALDLARRSN
ncbi:glycoside hydrolase family 6 protein [Micromonospora sp. NPDC049559]|uniref:glycoside hydrolase family 6 protein n=1 Tax=Micromonospora sp. NPDC049559 TaxID=3155923 RepID=UPI00344A8BE3